MVRVRVRVRVRMGRYKLLLWWKGRKERKGAGEGAPGSGKEIDDKILR